MSEFKVIAIARNAFCKVDEDVHANLARFRWHLSGNGYAQREIRHPNGARTTMKMHRELMGVFNGEPKQIKHINGDILDNRRANLRFCTAQPNIWVPSKCEIVAVSGKGVAVVDPDDFDRLSRFKWYLCGNGYFTRAARDESKEYPWRMEGMHRTILGLEPGDKRHVDHINGDRLDNRKANLRICTPQQNFANRRIGKNNTSGFKGVGRSRDGRHWHARATVQGQRHHLGKFDCPEDAHEFYCLFIDMVFGEFANHG